MILFYIPIVCVPELHKYGIANRLHTHLLYGHFQDISIENHDNSRNTEAMEGKLEQSQSILGEQREGDKQTAIMKKQQSDSLLVSSP
jgi:hypothetical protein